MNSIGLAVAVVCGVAVGLVTLAGYPGGLDIVYGWLLLGLAFAAALLAIIARSNERALWTSLLVAFALAGAGRALLTHPPVTSADLAYYNGSATGPTVDVQGIVSSEPTFSDRAQSVRIAAVSIKMSINAPGRPISGEMIAVVPRNPERAIGDNLIVSGKLTAPPSFSGFDYASYLAHQGVFSYMSFPKVTVKGSEDGGIEPYIIAQRMAARRTLQGALAEPEASIAVGVVTGDRMLSNEIYAGTWHYGKRIVVEPSNPAKRKNENPKNPKSSREHRPRAEWLSAPAPAIVSQSLYDAIQERLDHNAAMSPRNSKYQYLLRGLIVCSRCGHKMYGNSKNPNSPGGPRMVYSCSGRYKSHSHLPMAERCNQKCLRGQRLETLIWAEVVEQLSDEDKLRKLLEDREAARRRGQMGDQAELEGICTVEAALKRQANKDLDLYESDIIDKETLRERLAVIREKQDLVAKSKAEVTRRITQRGQGGDNTKAIKQLCEVARVGLPHLDFAERRAFLEGMDVQILADGDQVKVTGLITDRTLSLASKREHSTATDGVLRYSHRGGPPVALL